MKLAALSIVGGGAILVESATGFPYPVAPGEFLNAVDAEEFLRWAGEAISYAPVHTRVLVRQWKEVRDWLACDACPDGKFGRVAPGEAICRTCRDEAEHESTRRASA